jgi:hypothetical protein
LSKLLKFCDGWKFIIGGATLLVVKVWDGMHGTHYGDFTGSLLAAFGWDSEGGGFAAEAAGPTIVLIGIVHQFIKAGKQAHAGAPIASLLSSEGYVIKHEVDLAEGKPSAEKTADKAIEAVLKKEDDMELEWKTVGKVPEVKVLPKLEIPVQELKPEPAPAPAPESTTPRLVDMRSKVGLAIGAKVPLPGGKWGVVISSKEQSSTGYTYLVSEIQ